MKKLRSIVDRSRRVSVSVFVCTFSKDEDQNGNKRVLKIYAPTYNEVKASIDFFIEANRIDFAE